MSNKTPFLIGVFVGAAVIPILGFAAFGWKLDAKAQIMAQDAANSAVEKVLVPVCVARFEADPDITTHKAALKAEQYTHPRVEYIEKGGWATLPGQKNPISGIARSCESAIHATL